MSIGSGDATCALFGGEAVLLPERGVFRGVEGQGELEGGGTSLSTTILFPLLPTVSTHSTSCTCGHREPLAFFFGIFI